MDRVTKIVRRVREYVGASLVQVGLRVAGFVPIDDPSPDVEEDERDAPPPRQAELSPTAREMVTPKPAPASPEPPKPLRGSLADRQQRARQRGFS